MGLLPFDDVTLPFCDDEGRPRPFTVIHGGAGVGKTTVLGAIAATRPGFAVVPPGRAASRGGSASEDPAPAPHAICEWATGQDDPSRPHTLCITTPTVRLWNDEEEEAFRRREQALYDKRAREGGYVFVALPSTRWFSRQPIGINAPAQTLARYDVRAPVSFDDASRSDRGARPNKPSPTPRSPERSRMRARSDRPTRAVSAARCSGLRCARP